ncbi:MAG: type II secretion system protein [Alphaproteobacteria bacterium]
MSRILKRHQKLAKAFSLIELSIVILIIGVLVAGVTQSSRLVKRIRLLTAQNITNSSPVPTIKDLALWYEATLEKSFNDTEEQDLSELTMWYDNNPQATYKLNAFPPLTNNRPKFIENGINGLPSVRLAGVDDYLRVDQVGISGPQLTYFIVARRIAWVQDSSIINGTGPSGNDYTNVESFTGFYEGGGGGMIPGRNSGLLCLAMLGSHPGNGNSFIADSVFNGSTNIAYINGTGYTPANSTGNFNITQIHIGPRISGGNPSIYYNADIAEIIFYSRALNTEERKAVEQYLSRKWAIKIAS